MPDKCFFNISAEDFTNLAEILSIPVPFEVFNVLIKYSFARANVNDLILFIFCIAFMRS